MINNDKIYHQQLKVFNCIIKDNKLSSNFITNLFTFISDRIIFLILNQENDILNNSEYLPEEGDNDYQKLKKRIFNIYKKGKKYNKTNININTLKKYFPNEKEFALLLFDHYVLKKEKLYIFNSYNLEGKNDMEHFLPYYDKHRNFFEKKESEQLSSIDIENYYWQMNRKVVINIAFIGSRMSGKWTTIGHLLYTTGNIDQNYFEITKETAREIWGISYKYAWLLDRNWHERTYKKTLDIHLKKLETQKHDFNLIDLPGDFRLRKTILKGLSLADSTKGIRQLIFAINKMDKTKDIKYSEKMFIQLKKQMLTLSKTVGFDINNIQFVAYSGLKGQNLKNRYEDESNIKINKMDWYKGKTLLESLDELKAPKRDLDGPLKISFFNVYKITGVGTVLEGKILSGKLVTDMEIYLPTIDGIQKKICNSIEIHYHQIKRQLQEIL